MLVLEYCENGTLHAHIRGSSPETVGTTMLLTYCHDVALGMHYLSSRRVVHRDVAARNILVDVSRTCKGEFSLLSALSTVQLCNFEWCMSAIHHVRFTKVNTGFSQWPILECRPR